jgi:hypothetical protein
MADETDVHLAEYQLLRSEIEMYVQRIDRTISLYYAAILALIAFALRPESKIDAAFLAGLSANPTSTALMLLVSILNALLLARTAFLMMTVLTMAQYIDAIVAPRMSTILNARVLDWDRSESDGIKAQMLWVRRIVQFQTCLAAESVSVYILFAFRHAIRLHPLLVLLYVGSICCVLVSVALFLVVARTGRYFRRSRVEVSRP